MKKQLFVIAALAATFSAAAALPQTDLIASPKFKAPRYEGTTQNSVTYSYCQGNEIMGIGTGVSLQTLGVAIEIPENVAASFKGNKITAINCGIGQSSNKNITVFISEDLSAAPGYTQAASITQKSWNMVDLAVPYEITGKRFYVGYTVMTRSTTDYPLGFDGIPTASQLGDNISQNNVWMHVGTQFGNATLQAIISGESLEANNVALTGGEAPLYVKPGESFSITATALNVGTVDVTSLTFSAQVGSTKFETVDSKVSPSTITTGGMATVTVSGLVASEESRTLPVTITVKEVNGETNVPHNTYTMTTLSIESGYERAVVAEEWTGTWCGWCPRGIVGMGYMQENYGDKGFIGIAAHNEDAMAIDAYQYIINVYSEGFPGAIVNRMISVDPNKAELAAAYNIIRDIPAVGTVEVTASVSETTPSTIDVVAQSTFNLDMTGNPFSLIVVLKEDQVGPYPQTNYFAGGQNGKMDGWESKSSRVNTVFDDVARAIEGPFGIQNSLPGTITKDKTYTYKTVLSTANVADVNNCSVVVMILDNNDGTIENAGIAHVAGGADVNDVFGEEAALDVRASGNVVEIVGDCDYCSVYGIDGRVVKFVEGVSTVELPAGLYIVKAVGGGNSVTKKVSVR